MTTWVIIGTTSAMGLAFARKCASEGAQLLITTRKAVDAKPLVSDLHIRGAKEITSVTLDLGKTGGSAELLERVSTIPGEINVAFFAGSMSEQSQLNADPLLAARTYTENLIGPADCLQRLALIMEERGCGTIIALSSVAGDRGRASNYSYGSAKAGWSAFLSGLRNRLHDAGVKVVTVKPGFVDTDMTWGLPGLFLVASPDAVAERLWQARLGRKDVIYVPGFWRWIMLIIRLIPEPVFKKLKL